MMNVIYLNRYQVTCVICETEFTQSPGDKSYGVARYEDEVVPDNYKGGWAGAPACVVCYRIERVLHQENPQAFIPFADIRKAKTTYRELCR